MVRQVYIYELVHPLTRVPRYIGKTRKLLKERLKGHIKDSETRESNHKACWIRSVLRETGMYPIINAIDQVPFSEWEFWEKYWISQYRTWGFNLTNSTDGGESETEYTPEYRQNLSLSHRGKKRSRQSIEKLKKTLSSKTLYERQSGRRAVVERYGEEGLKEIASRVAKSRKENNEKWHSEETKLAIGLANKGKTRSGVLRRKEVIEIKPEGEIITYPSVTEALKINQNLHKFLNSDTLFKGSLWRYKNGR